MADLVRISNDEGSQCYKMTRMDLWAILLGYLSSSLIGCYCFVRFLTVCDTFS
ncbi:hypothetical protein RchiOBHm_Chr7g0206711 [Rosa chinensis]|uniref:Transmembrane protein n=1 Tax=Rosa chinensis TaxID=74649 RepID=A0A2P6P992_ROSCH|nr:hypothetical protein RchiOBHm_Chr7g0206711 [Rosa chinensis]